MNAAEVWRIQSAEILGERRLERGGGIQPEGELRENQLK